MSRDQRRLHAYHDGELGGLARWRFERRLRRRPELRAELGRLERLADLVREGETGAPAPDLWDGIALRLPAVDARREQAEPRAPLLSGWLRPLGAAAAAAAVAWLAVYGGVFDADPTRRGAVRWMDSGGRPVMVLEDQADVTIIWMLDEAVEGAARGGGRDVA